MHALRIWRMLLMRVILCYTISVGPEDYSCHGPHARAHLTRHSLQGTSLECFLAAIHDAHAPSSCGRPCRVAPHITTVDSSWVMHDVICINDKQPFEGILKLKSAHAGD